MSQPWKPDKMVWWYWSLLDEMIAHPEMTKKDFAAKFHVSLACICLITNSDLFKAHLDERRKANALQVDVMVRHRLAVVADRGLALMAAQIEKKRDSIPIADLTKMVDSTLEKLGYGLKGQAPVTVNTSGPTQIVVPVSREELELARAKLREKEMLRIEEAAE